MPWQEKWAENPTRLSVFSSQGFPKWFRWQISLKGKKRKPPGSIMLTFYSFLEGSQHLHVMAIMKCIGIAYFQYQHRRRHWYSTILAPRNKWFQKGTFTKNKSDFRNWLRTAKITTVVPEAPGSDQPSVLTGFTFNKIWQCNLSALLNLCLPQQK